MEEIVERNDVDISKIFNWGMAYDVINPSTEEVEATVYMKLLGDADLSRARVYAIRKSSELRRKLRDDNSDERIAYIRAQDDLSEEDLTNLIIIYSSRDISETARKNVNIKPPKPPRSDAPLEEIEKFQKDVDEYPQRRSKAVTDAMEKEVEVVKKSLSHLSKTELYKKYVKLATDEFCEREALEAFKNMQVFLGCFTSDSYSDRFFKDFDSFDNLEPTIKQNFKDAYDSLDIDIRELKKLRRATQ